MTLLLLSLLAAPATATHNVRDFGAVGDGATDDTAALQRAIDAAAPAGGVVFVPPGKYLCAGNLTIHASVTLLGTWQAPATVDRYHLGGDPSAGPELRGSVLMPVGGHGDERGPAFIRLGFNATLRGLTIFYPRQTKTNPPVPYPWCVQSAGADNPAIVDVLMVNPYQAVDFGTHVAGRHFIRNLYAQPLRRGLFVDRCYDVGRLENIHFWPFWTAADQDSPVSRFMLEQGEAFILARSDWELVSGCFCIGYHVGFRFINSAAEGGLGGGGNYLITQGGADMCQVAVLAEHTQGHAGVSFSNCQIFGDVVVAPTNDGMIRFSACGLFGSVDGARGTALAKLAGRGRVSFDGCHFYCIHPASRNAEVLLLVESGRVSIQNCEFLNSAVTAGVNSNPVPIVLGPEVRSAVIIGNEFRGAARIENRSRGEVVLEHNLERTDEVPLPAATPATGSGPPAPGRRRQRPAR